MGAVHTFDADTAGDHDTHEFWGQLYRRYFTDYATHSVVTEKAAQKSGIDHRVRLSGGGEVLVDCKCRCSSERWHDDILVEVWSDRAGRKPGWARKSLRCHYIAYGWPQFEVGFMVPFHALRRAYERNKDAWAALCEDDSSGLRVVDANNGRYVTRSVAVPLKRLLSDVAEAGTVYIDPKCEPF